ncbi:transcriptional regulator, LacI family [Klenkia soli]|uniref:Transcriptional regulator, LacI family n=1 Tax=Klenkia soli TaxID=1052260 RepID=A0A1H0U6P1_9ACTN|nr:LacI family DNA-binding transcriptional regulator [Klenkia soli]SDP61655.1 transcriptional regulator, LacI family [Klenkia soli]
MDIGEIARRAGVARSTVSYALSGKRPISAATRARIEAVMAEADFVPNAAARTLARGRSQMIGLAVPPVDGHLTAGQLTLVGAVAEVAADADHDVVLAPAGVRHASFERLVQTRRVDGVLVVEAQVDDPRVERLQRSGMPFVVLGRTGVTEGYDWVDVDFAAMVRRCVQHLVGLGRRELVLVNRSPALVDAGYGPAVRSARAFVDECARHGVPGAVLPCADDPAAGAALAAELADRHPGCDGLVTVNDEALPGLLAALPARGRDVPGRVSVCGVVPGPRVTGCDVPLRQLAEVGVAALLARLDGGTAPVAALLELPLVERGTTAPARP